MGDITLPARLPGSSAPIRGNPALPDAGNVPQAPIASDPGVVVPKGAFSDGDGLVAAGQGGQELAQRLGAAAERQQARADAVERARDLSAYKSVVGDEARRIETEGDLSKPEQVTSFGQFLQQKTDAVLAAHRGTDDSRARLAVQLEDAKYKVGDDIAIKSVLAQRAVVANTITSQLDGLTSEALHDPTALPGLFKKWDATIDDLSPAIPAQDRQKYADLGRQQIILNTAQGQLERGNWREAKAAFDADPSLTAMLAPDQQRTLAERFGRFERADAEAATAGQRVLAQATTVLGRAPTLAERVRLAGLAPPQGAETPTQKIALIEAAIGRPLDQAERERAAGVTDPVSLQNTSTIRKEFTKESGTFVDVRDAYNRIQAVASGEPSAAGDLSLIFSYMKILDPGSVVREGEQASAANAAGIPDQIRNLYNRALTGEKLAPKQREDFLNQSNKLFKAAVGTQQQLEQQYGDIAKKSGFDPSHVLVDFIGPHRAAQPGAAGPTGSQPVIEYDLQGKRLRGGSAK